MGSLGFIGSAGFVGSIGPIGFTGSAGSGSEGSGLSQRFTRTVTLTVPAGETSEIDAAFFKGYVLYRILVNAEGWFRFYNSPTLRQTDSTRSISDEPNYNSGVILELITTGPENVFLTPAVVGFNWEGGDTIPMSITNPTSDSISYVVLITGVKIEL